MRGFRGDENPPLSKEQIIGALLGGNYAWVEELIPDLRKVEYILDAIVKEAWLLGLTDWISEMREKFPRVFSDERVASGYILAGLPYSADDIPESYDPVFVFEDMLTAKNYNLDYIRDHIEELDEDILEDMAIPCALGEIFGRVDDFSGCTPEEFEKWRDEESPFLRAISDAMREGNRVLVDYFMQGKVPAANVISFSGPAQAYGYKDIWFYLYRRGDFRSIGDSGSADMDSFMLLTQQNRRSSFLDINKMMPPKEDIL
jgi:hypothetical protein